MPSGASLASSANSRMHNMGYKVRNLALASSPDIEIALNGNEGGPTSFVYTYSTLDRIEGTVTITPKTDTKFDDIEIAFVGSTKTWVDRLSSSATGVTGRTEGTQRFLKMVQPVPEDNMPLPKVLEAGRRYRIPFTFVVPEKLLPRACPHIVKGDNIKQAHMNLPPSLGDSSISSYNGVLRDDMAPEMAKISYSITARVTRVFHSDEMEHNIATASKKVLIKPALEEQPPLSVDAKSEEYRLRQQKTIRKGMLKGKLGKIVVEVEQPRSFHIPARNPDHASDIEPISTKAKIRLRFDPADRNSQPPKLGSLSSKLKVNTFFASSARRSFPERAGMGFDMSQGYYDESIALSTRCVASVQWTRHDTSSPPLHRRESNDSGISDCSDEVGASDTYSGGVYHTAELVVPVTLPTNKHFVPTFHSCLVSRVYALGLQLSLGPQHTASFSLKAPIQISAEGSVSGAAQRRASDAAVWALQEAEALFEPRSTVAPASTAPGYGQHNASISLPVTNDGVEAPPGYQAFDPARRHTMRL